MLTTTDTELLEETKLPGQRPPSNILSRGFALARRNWPLIVWAYAVNLVFGLLAGMPFAAGLTPFLDHSLASQRIAGTLDLAALLELGLHLRDGNFAPIGFTAARWLNLLQLLILFLFSTGTVVLYLSGEAPRLSLMVRSGLEYFWRLVRGNLMAGCIGGLVLGLLLAIRAALLARLSDASPGGTLFTYSVATFAVVFLCAMLFRLWLDLVEIYIVRLTLQGELRARRALLPAWHLLKRHFFRLFGGFLLAALVGAGGLAVCLLLWKALPPNQVWLAVLLGQVGLLLFLAARYWQRGLEVALLLAADLAVEPATTEPREAVEIQQEPALPLEEDAVTVLAEPTLMELVQKLRSDPWTRPTDATQGTATPLKLTAGLPEAETQAKQAATPETKPDEVADSPLLSRHATKFPLGGPTQSAEPGSAVEPDAGSSQQAPKPPA